MTGTKPARQSVTIISAAVTILALIANQGLGMVITEEEQQKLVDLITSGIALAGGIGAWYGRVRATTQISKS